jgi:transaldolase / glucose-6-phosphate isomerase
MTRSSILQLLDQGQSVWLDNLSRDLLTTGGLEKLRRRGIRGVTSNPTIFHKAIAETSNYDEAIQAAARKKTSVSDIYESLVIDDIRGAADVMRPVYDESGGGDGFVSLEVAPDLAYDTERSLEEARRLFKEIARPNVMIKIPGTPAGVPAIRSAIAAGVNINITLLFSVKAHEAVIDAYLSGLEARLADGKPIDGIASVASFFVSRVDTAVDKILEEKKQTSLAGKAAIANARLAYRLFLDRFSSPRFAELRKRGARLQRPLWASTSTKNPKYRDVMYCEELIGPDTVDTMPPATIEAFEDHGVVKRTLPEDVSAARKTIAELAAAGVDLERVCEKLVDEGVKSFAKSFADLMDGIERKIRQLVPSR